MDRLDHAACYRALQIRDARFDGRLFVGVRSTGVYCRPVCPARTPKREHCRFFRSAASAQQAGFRPCLRCRPETAPGGGAWRGSGGTVSRALALIADGGLDGAAGVETLALRLGMGDRQLRRLFRRHLGASPIAVAQTRRVLLAKQLIHETRLPLTDVAFAAGYGSVRRFNESFQRLFGRPPGALRRAGMAPAASRDAAVTLRLRHRPPYDWAAMLAHLGARAIAGVEEVAGGVYRRTVALDGASGTVEVRHEPAACTLAITARLASVRALPALLERVRRLFDIEADIETIATHLGGDALLAPLVVARPGLRVPGAWDGFELAVRAVLGQQVTVEAARGLAGRLVALCGDQLPAAVRRGPSLTHAFPTPERLARADLGSLGMPASRRATLVRLARAVLEDADLLRPGTAIPTAMARLAAIPGIGDWTAQYVALRALQDPDAFPAADIGLLRAASAGGGARPTPAALLRRAERWRPWRAYAAQHLWTARAAPDVVHDDRTEDEVAHG